MAGDWIKMRTSLLTNPRVNGIARALEADGKVSRALATGDAASMSEIVTRNVMRHVTVSSLLIVWGAANEHTRDGVFRNADLSDIDDMVGVPGFGAAMASVGWAFHDAQECCVTLPNFNEYNTSGQERSAQAKTSAERQKDYRERKKSQESDVTRDVTSDVTRNRREEKRREEKKEDTFSEYVVGAADAAHADQVASALPSVQQPATQPKAQPLPADWQLPQAWGEWALAEFPHWTADVVRLEGEKFADLWRTKAGKDARNADWQAAWRNWCRSDIAQRAHPVPMAVRAVETPYQRSMRERMQEAAPEFARRDPSRPMQNAAEFFVVEATNKRLEIGNEPSASLG
jgi:hypothetical protein